MNKKLTTGIGVAALAAGAYFFLGPDGQKHRKKMRGWMVQMKGQVLEKLEEAQEVTQPVYNEIVDTVVEANTVAGKVPASEILALGRDLKRHWSVIKRSFGGPSKPAKKSSKKATKKKSSRR